MQVLWAVNRKVLWTILRQFLVFQRSKLDRIQPRGCLKFPPFQQKLSLKLILQISTSIQPCIGKFVQITRSQSQQFYFIAQRKFTCIIILRSLSFLFRQTGELITQLSEPAPDSSDLYFPTQYAQPFYVQCQACLWKIHKSYWRNPLYNVVRLCFTVFCAIVFGTIFWGLGKKRYEL
jgi:hypothetical protein